MAILAVVVSDDRYLGANLSSVVISEGYRQIRTADKERIIKEAKRTERLFILDIACPLFEEPGVLRQVVNIARISGNTIAAICPNTDEKLKKLARDVRVDQVFIRYDIELSFREFLKSFVPKS